MRTFKPLAALVAAVLASSSMHVLAENGFDVKAQTATGKPAFVVGDLGGALTQTPVESLKRIIRVRAPFAANGNEDFVVTQQWQDKHGKQHTRVRQTINGLNVYGTSMIIHSNTDTAARGAVNSKVYAVSGVLATNDEGRVQSRGISKNQLRQERVRRQALSHGQVESLPELSYVYLPLSGETHLAWRVEVSWNNSAHDFGHDVLFYNESGSEVLTRYALVHSAKNFQTYTLDNQEKEYAPGRLLCTNAQNCGDASAQRAHTGASQVYDYYKATFGRKGIDNRDMTMVSSVHLGNNVANAFWTGSQMLYGDGDGDILDDLTLSYDVIGHELTHGVIQHTAGLKYQNASGALNEAFADIFGVSAKARRDGTDQPDWWLAKESFTPNKAGDAMRYMNNPTKDNYSKDWYPERIPFVSNPSNTNDYGGVHGNSGIANLAYALLVDGGSHPRGKSNAVVQGVGLSKAEQIFYRALTTYMTESTDFTGARSATAQAAQDLYGAAEKTSVETAWCAVGVGTCPSAGGGNNGGGNLQPIKGAVNNIYVPANTWGRYVQDLPAGYRKLTVTLSGGWGDADLYLRYGSESTQQQFDCRSWNNGNTEVCTIDNPKAGRWHIDLHGYSASYGATLSLEATP